MLFYPCLYKKIQHHPEDFETALFCAFGIYATRHLLYRDGLGKVAGLIHIAALNDRNMVCQELQRNHCQKRG